MSERRRARAARRSVPSSSTARGVDEEAPWQLTGDGSGMEFWGDERAVRAFIVEQGLPDPDPSFWGFPRALRDHCARQWCIRNGYVNRWGMPNWERARQIGVGPSGSARARARLGGAR